MSAPKKVSEIMSKNPTTLKADSYLVDAAKLMKQHGVGCIPVYDSDPNEITGIITGSLMLLL